MTRRRRGKPTYRVKFSQEKATQRNRRNVTINTVRMLGSWQNDYPKMPLQVLGLPTIASSDYYATIVADAPKNTDRFGPPPNILTYWRVSEQWVTDYDLSHIGLRCRSSIKIADSLFDYNLIWTTVDILTYWFVATRWMIGPGFGHVGLRGQIPN